MIIVGTCGWQYRDWRGPLYPAGLAQRRWLAHYATTFTAVEIDSAFYRLPPTETFAQWRQQVPAGFRFAVKMSRYLTHVRRLREPAEPVARFLAAAGGLGDRLGPVLLQLPPTLRVDVTALDAVLSGLDGKAKVAVEPRHPSWWHRQVREVLQRHNAALCWADRLGRPVTPLWRTADFGYLRLHEGRAHPRPRYGQAALRSWVSRIRAHFDDETVYAFFNNDPGGAAVADALAFTRLIGSSRSGGCHAAGRPSPRTRGS